MVQLPQPTVLLDVERRIVAVSAAASELLGPATELVGEPFGEVLEERRVLLGAAHEVTAPSDEGATIIPVRTSDGRTALLQVSEGEVELEDAPATVVQLCVLARSFLEQAAERRRNQTAIDKWEIGVFEHDHLTNGVYGSPRLREQFGFAPDEVLSVDSFVRAVHPSDSEPLRTAIHRAHDPTGNGCFEIVHRVLHADGEWRWLHSRAQTRFGEVEGVRRNIVTSGSIVDITEREVLAQALQRNEQRLSEAIQASRVGVFDQDHMAATASQELYWSPTFREIVGARDEQPPDQAWFMDRIHPADQGRVRGSIERARDPAGGGQYEAEFRWAHPDGQNRSLLLRATIDFAEVNGRRRPVRTVGALLDVSDAKAAQQERRRRAEILDATPDFVGMSDLEGRPLFLNRAARDFIGAGPHEDVGDWTIHSVHTPSSRRLVLEEGVPTAIRQGLWKAETEFARHDGQVVPMSQVLLAHRDESGRVTHLSTVARDLSREKELEEQFRQAQKLEAIGRLAGGVAHDFNNLLSVIGGFVELASVRARRGHDVQEELGQVSRAAERAAALTKQLLAFSRKQILKPRVIDVNDVLADMGRMIRRLVDDTIRVNVVTGFDAIHIKADPHQLEQVILNLVVNARDAMPNGGLLRIEAGHERLDDDSGLLELGAGLYATIAVSDTGVGMNVETRQRIFEPFFTTKGPGQGTGLGLSTVFGIVKQSGGSVWVGSEPGQGATFKLYFPCTDEHTPAAVTSRPVRRKIQGGVILLAEDDTQVREMITDSLTSAGYQVLPAASGEEALKRARQHGGAIDLLLTDVLMPGISGRQLAERLLRERPLTEVLYMSGYAEDSVVRHGVLEEGVTLLPKPLTPQRLIDAIEQVLGGGAEAGRA